MEKNDITAEITLDQVRPYLDSVVIKKDTRPHWGSPDINWVRKAMDITGFKTFDVKILGNETYTYDCDVDRFLMADYYVDENGIFIIHEDEDYHNQILDYENVRKHIDEIIRVAYVLEDESLMLCKAAVRKVAERAFRQMERQWQHTKVRPNFCVVSLSPMQWENVCRMNAPQPFKSNSYRQYVHDPWVTMEVDDAVVWEVEVWQWEGNRHWTESGFCVFIKEGTTPRFTKDFPMDYWD